MRNRGFTIIRSCLLAATMLLVVDATTYAAQSQVATPKVSQANADKFRQLRAAMTARRYAEVDSTAKAVLASSQKTRDDTFAAYVYLMQSAQARNDVPGQMEALEGQLASGFLPASAHAEYYRNLMGLAYKLPDYHKAVEYGQQLIKTGDASPEAYQYVGQAYYELKDYKSAVNFFSNLVSEKEKAGRKPDRNELILLQSSYAKAGKAAEAQATLQKVVRYYPDPATWMLLIHDVRGGRLDYKQKVQLYRLMQATGNLKQPQDYMDYSDAATAIGLHGESRQVLDTGLNSNVFTSGAERSRAERYRNSAAAQVAAQQAGLSQLEAAARKSSTGNEYVNLGITLYSLGQYDKAAEALKAGMAKGNLVNAADAQMNLGMALLKAGQKAEALKSFRAARPADETTQRMAELWALYTS
jgi:tetratricopeptide (TPR) repeat protein